MPRPRKTEATRQIQQTLTESAVYAAKLVLYTLRGIDGDGRKTRRVSSAKLQAAFKAIEHAIGLPKAKIELKTDALTMKDIAELAVAFNVNDADNPGKDGESSLESIPIIDIPTKPLTARQVKERAKARAEQEAN